MPSLLYAFAVREYLRYERHHCAARGKAAAWPRSCWRARYKGRYWFCRTHGARVMPRCR